MHLADLPKAWWWITKGPSTIRACWKLSQRKWWITDDEEWICLQDNRDFNTFSLTAKVFTDRLPNPARCRSQLIRANYPRSCTSCGCQEYKWILRTPTQHQIGAQWRHRCIGSIRQPAAFLGERWAPKNPLHQTPAAPTGLTSSDDDCKSSFKPCPFCGLGERCCRRLVCSQS